MKRLGACIFGIILLTVSTVASGAPLGRAVPATGQTKCYDNSAEIACPATGQPFFGQDATYKINPPSYIKLDERGSMLPDSAASWSMVLDNVTGLIWETKGLENYADPHAGENTYYWRDTNPATNGGDPGAPAPRPKSGFNGYTEEFIKALNSAGFGGYRDWRMPTVAELASLVDYENRAPGPARIHRYFRDREDTMPGQFWTSATVAGNPHAAWYVDFYDGVVHMAGKYSDVTTVKIPINPPYFISYTFAPTFPNRYARAVRGEMSVGAGYRNNADGTVTDRATGLTWQQAGTPEPMTWQEALAYCDTLNIGDPGEWRLPSIRELLSLVDYDRSAPSIDAAFFPGTAASPYWSSTTAAGSKAYGIETFDGAWAVNFSHGATATSKSSGGIYTYESAKKKTKQSVRCVRGPANVCLGCTLFECTATTDANWTIHLPLLEHVSLIDRRNSAVLIKEAPNVYRLEEEGGAVQKPSPSCAPATVLSPSLSYDSSARIHIPEVLLPDKITRLWLDLEYNQLLGAWSLKNGGLVPKSRARQP